MEKNPSIVLTEQLDALAEEIKATFIERVTNARDEVIRAHHETGKAMHAFHEKHPDMKNSVLVQTLALRGAGKEKTLYLCDKFYEKYPNLNDIDSLGHGKAISWNKIRAALEPPKEELAVHKIIEVEVTVAEWEEARKIEGEAGDEVNIEAIGGTVRLKIV